ncbi:LysR family transcriptional regulator, partial [Pseudomonas sp.]
MSRNRTIDLTLLRTFVGVAEAGSISAAARRLHVTQGGISQQIKRLE